MRICLYTESALPMIGGQEMVVDALARQFLAQGHKPVVLAPRPRRGFRLQDDELPYPVQRHPRYLSTRRLLDWYRLYLSRVYRKYRFDVLHCHSVYPAGYIGVRWAARTGVPVVLTSHCGDICPSSRLLSKPGLPARFAAALHDADAAVAISGFTERRMRELCAGIRRIERIPNGVDAARFAAPARRPETLDRQIQPGGYFLFLGRLVPRKGADLLLDAFARAGPASGRLVIAGTGPEEAALKERAVALGIGGRADFVGHVAGELKTYLLQNAVALVIPSRISEGFPLVLLESAAAGRAVIGTDIPGLGELIGVQRAGLLVPAESAELLASAMRHMEADRPLAERLGAEARCLARRLDWSSIALEYVALFEALLASRALPRAA